jgi:hypothetical protein
MEIPRRIILACSIAGILVVPAKAFDGTPSPDKVRPTIEAPPVDLLLCGYASWLAQANPGGPAFGQGVDPLIGTWKLNVEKSASTAFWTAQKSAPDD